MTPGVKPWVLCAGALASVSWGVCVLGCICPTWGALTCAAAAHLERLPEKELWREERLE